MMDAGRGQELGAEQCQGTETSYRVMAASGTAAATAGGVLFHLQYPGYGVDEHHYKDSQEFMDLLLKGIAVPRVVGSQAVRITSAGPAMQETLVRDSYGRSGSCAAGRSATPTRIWSTLALPTPDGYAGMLAHDAERPGGGADRGAEAAVADYVYVSYTGSLPQWQAFLQRRDLRPAVFDHIKLAYEFGKDLRFDSPRLQFDSAGVVPQSGRRARSTCA